MFSGPALEVLSFFLSLTRQVALNRRTNFLETLFNIHAMLRSADLVDDYEAKSLASQFRGRDHLIDHGAD